MENGEWTALGGIVNGNDNNNNTNNNIGKRIWHYIALALQSGVKCQRKPQGLLSPIFHAFLSFFFGILK